MIRVAIPAVFLRLLALLAAIVPGLVAFPAVAVAGPTVLYSFSAPTLGQAPPVTNSDGIAPASRLVLGRDGYLYGTALRGGANGAGSIFRMTIAGALTNLYSFPAATNSSGEVVYDLGPNDLAQGTNGNFYGTTRRGGSNFTGTIFVIFPSGSFGNLHTFAAETTNSSGDVTSGDGATPTGALALGNDGNFYGTTQYGGANGTGTIFKITPGGAFTSLYSFSRSPASAATTNGTVPNALVLGSNNVFYGTTQQGGVDNAGTFFKFSAPGGFAQIYSFNGEAPGNNPITPNGAMVQGTNGNFYGTSAFGGSQGGGSIFEIAGAGGATVLHSFPLLDAGAGAAITLGVDGNFYGVTAADGLNGEGTLFRMTPAGDFGAYSFSPLNTNSENADGANPSAALTADAAGNLYGACAAGGTNGSGVIFQIFGPAFVPPFFIPVTNPPPPLTNVLVGASVTLSYAAQGLAPLTYQWLRNGTNLTDGGDIVGSLTNSLIINPVFPRDVGSYALVISNTLGALTSAVTVVTVAPPGISISSPAPNASTAAPVFAGTATNAPLFANTDPGEAVLTDVIFSISNLLNGSNITGVAAITGGAGAVSNWSFTATPFPGTNILSVQSVDVSGNISPAAFRTFFYEVPAPLTVLTAGSGTGAFTITNGALLNLGQSYSIAAKPISSVFNYWAANGVITFDSTLSFVMQSNLVLTADFISQKSPAVSISFPAANARTALSVYEGTAQSSPVLSGVNPGNVRLTNVTYWLTNIATGSIITGAAALTGGVTVSNWSVTVTPLPGTNTLAVQAEDVSGDFSPVVFRTFFYEVAAPLTVVTNGSGTGTVSITNGAPLYVGERYSITAKPDKFSSFGNWVSSAGGISSGPALSFVMQPDLVLTATFVAIPPVVTISSPAENLRTTAPVFKGTASGHFPIANVFCSLANTSGPATLTAGTGAVSNWSIALTPSQGTNTLTVYCEDIDGNKSAAVSRRFFYEVPSLLTVSIAGPGNGSFKGASSVAGDPVPANGAMLNVGESYKITAIPDKSSLFSNWAANAASGATVVSDTPALSFVMQSNLVLTVTFVVNFFPGVAETYNGLFFPGDAVSEETSGMLYNLVLQDTGAFSAKLLMAGTNYHIATSFDASGHASFNAGPLQVALTLDSAAAQITGTVSDSQFTANLTADLASNVLPPTEYTMLFSPSTNISPVSPPGDGYALVTNHAGVVTLNGALADGTSFSQTVPVSRTGDLPVYASLHAGSASTSLGLLLGWINLTDLQATAPSNALAWIKKPSRAPTLYTNGFTNILSVQGALWTNPPPKTPAISLTNGELVFSNGSLSLTFTNVAINSDNSLTNLGAQPTNALTGSVNPKTGFLIITFANGNAGRTTNYGAFLQTTTNAGGYFLTSTNAGAFNLQP